jgi:hypothetical protein
MKRAYPAFHTVDNLRGDALHDLMRSVRVIAGPPWPLHAKYWSNRLYVVAGYGGCLATPEVEGMAEEGWVAGTHYLKAERVGDYEAILAMPDDELRAVADAGQALCVNRYTYDHRVAEMVKHLEALRCPA